MQYQESSYYPPQTQAASSAGLGYQSQARSEPQGHPYATMDGGNSTGEPLLPRKQ
jgi:hypothetical protein